jgi:hypothetical protein
VEQFTHFLPIVWISQFQIFPKIYKEPAATSIKTGFLLDSFKKDVPDIDVLRAVSREG